MCLRGIVIFTNKRAQDQEWSNMKDALIFTSCYFCSPEPPVLFRHKQQSPVDTLSDKAGGKETVEALNQAIHPPLREALDGILISATEGDGLMELQLKIQDQVLKATKQKFFKIVIPADGPQLR